MDLRSHYPYWLLRHGIFNSYPSLDTSIKADVAIIGAGITGALVAHHLVKEGFKVVVVDRRHVGYGSTAASTSMLQYEIDTPLGELIEKVGERNAVRSYELSVRALRKLISLAGNYKDVEVKQRPSFQYASFQKDVKGLEKELALRKRHEISSVNWVSAEEIKENYGFDAPAGIVSEDGAELDCYSLTHTLFKFAMLSGLQLFDNTEIVGIRHHKNSVELKTKEGFKITAKKLVICCGYESQQYLPKKVEDQYSTYAIVSERYDRGDFWYRNSLIWETANPYLYMRTTSDNRILVGGKDDPFYNPEKRDSRIPMKRKQLEASFKKLFPDIPFKTDFAWAGTFCGTKDGLPYIGSVRQRSNTFFSLGFGGNGILFSYIGAEIIRDMLVGIENKDASIFSFNR